MANRFDVILHKASDRIAQLAENQTFEPSGQRRLSEREQVARFLALTPQQHAQGIAKHGAQNYAHYIDAMRRLKSKYDGRATDAE
ncbi:MAG: hypothetical protein KGL39_49180 [Patescibacteria group bacterium]|nr:hypothetical protein [Patescibacteria group bacterium]